MSDFISTSELAKKLGIKSRTVQTWVSDHGMPQHSRGKFTPDVLWWIIGYYQDIIKNKGIGTGTTNLNEKKLSLECDILEEKLAAKKGENCPIEVIEDAIFQIATIIKARIRSLPTLAAKLQSQNLQEMRATLRKRGDEILGDLSATKVRARLKTKKDTDD